MDWLQVFTIIGVLGGLIIFMVNKMDADIKAVCTRIDAQSARLDGHAQRMDQLYQVILEMLKEKKC
jgi:hypothetical protein